ncbi:hypothetical protein GCM10023189_14180 [Nibrella saemangeumensis]|uniref:Thioredoxin domain-containing protein n=1 Tax=Nibrella saemangeumensis TaxID=1084526 RepID=A0ABP8MMD1_9BACT
MSTTPANKKSWITYGVFAVLILVLFFTELGTTLRGGIQQVFLKTGLKDARAPEPDVPTTAVTVSPAEQPAPAASGPPYHLTLSSLDGKTVAFNSLAGKVIFLNQWATWCPPCRAEMPSIEKLYQSVDKNKVAFVMLSLDDSPEKARKYIEQNKFTFPVYVPAGPMPSDFATEAIPTTLILAPDGRIAQRMEGMFNYDTAEFRQYLDSLARSTKR